MPPYRQPQGTQKLNTYIYIYIERERERDTYVYIYIYIYICMFSFYRLPALTDQGAPTLCMCMCMSMCMCICVCVGILCMYVYVHMCMCRCGCRCLCLCLCLCPRLHLYVSVYVYVLPPCRKPQGARLPRSREPKIKMGSSGKGSQESGVVLWRCAEKGTRWSRFLRGTNSSSSQILPYYSQFSYIKISTSQREGLKFLNRG